MIRPRSIRLGLFAALAASAGCARPAPPAPPARAAQAPPISYVAPYPPAPQARWPWPRAVRDAPHRGVTHWLDRSAADGTVCELFRFNFAANPHLRLELYDQDEDDARPFDDRVDFWPHGVGDVTRHLNARGRGPVLAAWNGLFFDSARSPASHVAPVVLDGRVRENVGLVRWSFGVRDADRGRPRFLTLHEPTKAALAREYVFAAEGAQCLIRDGKPLALWPFPKTGDPAPKTPVPSTDREAGHVPEIDHCKTSRTTMGWSQDSQEFYLLIVKEPDGEAASIAALHGRGDPGGGWTLADEQRFWRAKGVWGAVNIDGGDVTQLSALRADGRYDLVPPRWASPSMRLTLGPGDAAPAGGTMMYFYVRDAGGKSAPQNRP